MSLRIVALTVALAAAMPAVAVAQRPSAAAPSAQRTAPSAAAPRDAARADTLHYTVRAGQPLLVSLPATVGGRPAAYRVVSAPAMSWLVDRSFFWQTLATESGQMAVVFEQSAGSDETLVLIVDIVG